MAFVKSQEDFINGIRAIDEKLANAKLVSVRIEKKEKRIKYSFICDQVINGALYEKVLDFVKKMTPEVERIAINFSKIATNTELINNEIHKFVCANYPSVSIMLDMADIRSFFAEDKANTVTYVIRLTQDTADYFTKSGAFNKINERLEKKFCAEFVGTYEIKKSEEIKSLLSEDVYADKIEEINYRTIKVNNVCVIDSFSLGDTAVYIEDAKEGGVVICGRITEIAERTAKTGKPYFILRLNDTTATISGLYFSRKKTYAKIKELKEGDAIIAGGTIEDYGGRPSFKIENINRCEFPSDFKKKDKYKKTAPKTYKTVFPSHASTVKVKSVFEKEEVLPRELTEKTYVVFDLETTGLDKAACEITEVGAVKIIDGKIAEQFVSLIKPDGKISAEITGITGIDDDMVKNAPKIAAVLPDFLKFSDGCTLVCMNADFDVSIMKRYAYGAEYAFSHEEEDIMIMGRQQIKGLNHYNLATLADYFGIVFHHHRALSDAYATAEIFIELMKMKYNA